MTTKKAVCLVENVVRGAKVNKTFIVREGVVCIVETGKDDIIPPFLVRDEGTVVGLNPNAAEHKEIFRQIEGG